MNNTADSVFPSFSKRVLSATALAVLTACLLSSGCASQPSTRARIIAMDAATVVDVESTYATLRQCPTCREGNPLMRGPVSQGRLVTYAMQFGWNAVVAKLAERADRNALWAKLTERPDREPRASSFWRHLPYSIIAGHSIAGALNLRLLGQVSTPLTPERAGLVSTIPIYLSPLPSPHDDIRAVHRRTPE